MARLRSHPPIHAMSAPHFASQPTTRYVRPVALAAAMAVFLMAACGPAEDAGDRGDPGRVAAAPTGCPGILGETVSWIVPFTPGGGYDVASRLLEPYLEQAIGAEIVVRNRPGAGGLAGTREIRDAKPDGRTLGILNAMGLLVQQVEEGFSGYDPVEDFTVLGRLTRAEPVWATARDSPYWTIEDLFSAGRDRPVLFGLVDVSSVGFLTASIAADLLGMEVEYLAGYGGSRETTLGLIRREVDLVGFNFESIRDRIEAGDLRPVLKIQERSESDHPLIRNLPSLAGVEGLAVRRARELGQDPEVARSRVDALVHLLDAGRIVAAPAGLEPALADCLRSRLEEAVTGPGFEGSMARSIRTLSYLDAPRLIETIQAARDTRSSLEAQVRRHIEMVRTGR